MGYIKLQVAANGGVQKIFDTDSVISVKLASSTEVSFILESGGSVSLQGTNFTNASLKRFNSALITAQNQMTGQVGHNAVEVEPTSPETFGNLIIVAAPNSGAAQSQLVHSFPLEQNITPLVKEGAALLNSTGEVYPIVVTGDVPLEFPIGVGSYFGDSELQYTDWRDSSIRFIDDDNDFIQFWCDNGSQDNYPVESIGGSVDNLGNFTYGAQNTNTQVSSMRYISFDIDESTFNLPVVKGLCVARSKNSSDPTKFYPFEYTVATKTFAFGPPQTLSSGYAGNQNRGATVRSIDPGKFAVFYFSGYNAGKLSIIDVTSLSTSTLVSTSVVGGWSYFTPREFGKIIKLTDDRMVLMFSDSTNYRVKGILWSMNGGASGNDAVQLSSSTLEMYADGASRVYGDFAVTRGLTPAGNFYCAQDVGSFDAHIQEVAFDAATDTFTKNPEIQLFSTSPGYSTALQSMDITDLTYIALNGKLLASGSNGSGVAKAFISDFAEGGLQVLEVPYNAYNKRVSTDVSTTGDMVFMMTDNSEGQNFYGRAGDIVSNFSAINMVGFAVDNDGSVAIEGSVVTLSGVALTVNGTVWMTNTGAVSTTNIEGSTNIGKALSATSFVLDIPWS